MYCENTLQVDVDITRLFEGSKWFRYEDGHPHSNSPIAKIYTNPQQTIPQTRYTQRAAFDNYYNLYREHALICMHAGCDKVECEQCIANTIYTKPMLFLVS